jgi:hypothetical protein
MSQQLADAQRVIATLNNKAMQQEVRGQWLNFSGECENLRRSGAVGIPDVKFLQKEFAGFGKHSNPAEALTLALERYRSLPKMKTPAKFNNGEPVFGGTVDDGRTPLQGRPINRSATAGTNGNGTPVRQIAQRALGQSSDPMTETFGAALEEMWENAAK